MLSSFKTRPVEAGPARASVLMLAPFRRQQRGNAITAERLYQELSKRGWPIDIQSLEDENCWQHIKNGIEKQSYRFVHSFNAFHTSEAFDRLSELKKLPFLLTTTGTDLHFGLTGTRAGDIRKLIEHAAYTIVFNQEFKRLLGFIPDLDHKVLTIPQGVWLDAAQSCPRSQLGLDAGDAVFILPSGLRPVKNLDLAIDGLGLARSTYPDLKLLVVGASLDQSYADCLLSRVSRLPWIKYLGEVPHSQMTSIYLLADVVVNSSLAEGQPQAALEAMSLGRPALLSAVPGNLGIMEHGREGFYFSRPEELADYALVLANNPGERIRMGELAAELTLSCFSLQAEIDSYEGLYRNLF